MCRAICSVTESRAEKSGDPSGFTKRGTITIITSALFIPEEKSLVAQNFLEVTVDGIK
jgi:hypothetical protein